MQNVEYYQPLITELLKRNIDFKVDNENEMINFEGSIYVCVEESRNNEEAIGYSVGAGVRERDFELDELSEVINYIEGKLKEENE